MNRTLITLIFFTSTAATAQVPTSNFPLDKESVFLSDDVDVLKPEEFAKYQVVPFLKDSQFFISKDRTPNAYFTYEYNPSRHILIENTPNYQGTYATLHNPMTNTSWVVKTGRDAVIGQNFCIFNKGDFNGGFSLINQKINDIYFAPILGYTRSNVSNTKISVDQSQPFQDQYVITNQRDAENLLSQLKVGTNVFTRYTSYTGDLITNSYPLDGFNNVMNYCEYSLKNI